MSYTPTDWKTGDVITAEKLNNMESGISNVVVYDFEVKSGQTGGVETDADIADITANINSGKICIANVDFSSQNMGNFTMFIELNSDGSLAAKSFVVDTMGTTQLLFASYSIKGYYDDDNQVWNAFLYAGTIDKLTTQT